MNGLRRNPAPAPVEAPVSVASMPTLSPDPGNGGPLGSVDHYSFVRKLGGGGFGTVYLAHDTVSGVDVAIKTLHPLLKRDAAEMQNLRAKFALVSRLAHPSIATALVLHTVRSVDFRNADTAAELGISPGDNVMVMRYAPGVSLSQWRRQFDGCIVPPDATIAVARQLASALDYAHGEKIIHRDIKPGNIIVETLDGGFRVRILDFGLAAEIRSSMSRVSNEKGDTSGTRPYMAPEQWSGLPQDGRTDQYALACVVYEMLCGAPPFAGVFDTGDPAIMRSAVMFEPPARIPGLSRAANSALARALAKRPEDRFSSCSGFIEALAAGIGSSSPIAPFALWNRIFASDRVASRRDPVSANTIGTSLERTAPSVDEMASGRMTPPEPREKAGGRFLGVLIVVAVSATTFFALRPEDKSDRQPTKPIPAAVPGGSAEGGQADLPDGDGKETGVDTDALRQDAEKAREAARDARAKLQEQGLVALLSETEKSAIDDALESGEAAFSRSSFETAKGWFDNAVGRLGEAGKNAETRISDLDGIRGKAESETGRFGRLGEWAGSEWDAHVAAFRDAEAMIDGSSATEAGLEAAQTALATLVREADWLEAEDGRRSEEKRQEEERMARIADLAAAKRAGAEASARILPAFRQWGDPAFSGAIGEADAAVAALGAIPDDADGAVDDACALADVISAKAAWMESNAAIRESLAETEARFEVLFAEADGDGLRTVSVAAETFGKAAAAAAEAAQLRDGGDYATACKRADDAVSALSAAMRKARDARRESDGNALAESEKALAALWPEARRVGVRDVAANTCALVDELVANVASKRESGDLAGAKKDCDLARYALDKAIAMVKEIRAKEGVENAEGFKKESQWRECLEAAEDVLSNWDPLNERARELRSEAWDHIHLVQRKTTNDSRPLLP